MKEYTDYIVDAYESQANRPRFIIDQLLPDSKDDFGVIAGRWWLGKTNMCLEMIFCLATGDPFFGLQVEQVPVVFLDFEGNPMNISERLMKIMGRHSIPPDGYLNIQNLKDNRFKLNGNIDRLVNEVRGAKVAVIDGTKHLIKGEYIKPSVIKSFGEDLLSAMQKGNFTAIVTWQVRKPHQNVLITPGDLFELKGAADRIEDATFALLLEKEPSRPLGKHKWYHPSDNHVNLYVGKAKEADQEFLSPFKEFEYEKATCEFKQR